MNPAMICITCGTQFPAYLPVPDICPICMDDRQHVPPEGQQWISPVKLRKKSSISIEPISLTLTENAASGRMQGTSLHKLKVAPHFALNNRAILVKSACGNILWDCIPMLDEHTIDYIGAMGGLKAIAISHPHYYSNMNDWAAVFNCPIYIHQLDADWVMDKGPQIKFWQGTELLLFDDIRIIHTGGHFAGSSVLSIPALSEAGTVLCGDSLYIARSKKHTAVMFSYPNQILLPREDFSSFEKKVSSISFDNLIGAFDHQELLGNARSVYEDSMQRYKSAYLL